jgi:hypothetical protein
LVSVAAYHHLSRLSAVPGENRSLRRRVNRRVHRRSNRGINRRGRGGIGLRRFFGIGVRKERIKQYHYSKSEEKKEGKRETGYAANAAGA